MTSHNAKYSFYYLLSLVSLIFTAVSAGLILFGIIDKTVADAWSYNYYRDVDGQFKFAISALLIAGPTYYLLVFLINKGLKKKELSLDSSLRRWLTYLIIFVNALIILGVFIGIVYNLLSGALTARFLLRLISIFLIAGTIFTYYFWDIKRSEVNGNKLFSRLFTIISAILLGAIFVSAWFFVQSPADARAKRLDQNLMNNINQLESAVNNYYSLYQRLPQSLEEMQSDPAVYLEARYLVDPETGAKIEYRQEGNDNFLLCAEFRRDSEEMDSYSRYNDSNKGYRAGYSCVSGKLWSKEVIPDMEKELKLQ